ncbi:MAG: uridine kinase, partial [Micrococcus sp.]|nr:uridine kinase [Micrococcus sp.]
MTDSSIPAPGSAVSGAGRRPRLVLLGGASGSGKSYLARKYGHPHFPLDAFYHQLADDAAVGGSGPVFPRTEYGEIDWDDVGTWDEQAAVDAIVALLEEGVTSVPDYDISSSSRVGEFTLDLEEGQTVVAEGIFASAMPAALARAGVECEAWYIDQPRELTAIRRFGRDV